MVEFLDTNEISSELYKMVTRSKEKLYLVSPYLQMSDKIKIMIQQAEKTSSKLDIKVVYRSNKDGELNDKDMDFLLNQLKNADVFALDNLHSKCYLNENTAIITSMNLYQHSQENNWEMGIKIDKSTESDIYEKISGHVSYMIDISKKHDKGLINLKNAPAKVNNVSAQPNYMVNKPNQVNNVKIVYTGYCIRCGNIINFDIGKPLCPTCFKSWSKYMDDSYQENYCHACGNENETSLSKPLCIYCYRQLNQ
jgi:phosphatidylserine/phosphatidylglycerophosphate/cardiolipin synthase-like enzyme